MLAWLDRPQQPSRSMRPRQPLQAKASSFRYPPGSAPRDPPPGKLKPLYTRSNSESVAFEQQSISIVAPRRAFNICGTLALRAIDAPAGSRKAARNIRCASNFFGLADLVEPCCAARRPTPRSAEFRLKNVPATVRAKGLTNCFRLSIVGDPPLASGRQGRGIGCDRQHVVVTQSIDHLLHQRRRCADAFAVLHIPELANDVVGMATGNGRHLAQALQGLAMADAACNRFAAARAH